MVEQIAPDVADFLTKVEGIENEGMPIAEKLPLPRIEDVPTELTTIAEEIKNISGTWNPVEIYTADESSRNAERQKLFDAFDRGEEYNPTLTYSYAESLDLTESRGQLKELMRSLRTFKSEKSDRTTRLFRVALYSKLKDDLAVCDLVDGIKSKNENKIANALKQKYPGTDESLITLAEEGYRALSINGDPDDQEEISGGGTLTPEQYKLLRSHEVTTEEQEEAFKWVLDYYGILKKIPEDFGYDVVSTKDVSGIDVRDKSKNGPTVYLPTDRSKPMTAEKLLLFLRHEIEGHALQSLNGEALFQVGGGRLKMDNEQLYEGRGLNLETDFRVTMYGQQEAVPRPYYVFATKMAEQGASFYDIFKDQVERRTHIKLKIPYNQPLPEFSAIDPKKQNEIKRESWLVTYRVMRGHIDTSNTQKFAMAKDLGYLRGFQIDKQLNEHGYGILNEAAIIASGGLQMLAEFNLSQNELPYQYQDATTKYCMEVLLPKLETQQTI